jgi:mono/diheme cytochrome c family protein
MNKDYLKRLCTPAGAALAIVVTLFVAISAVADSGDAGEESSEGERLFEERCSVCHDGGIPGIPTRETLASFSQVYILNALTEGLMFEQGYGLTDEQLGAIANYVSSESD